MSPLAFLGLYVFACIGAFALGLKFVGAREDKPGVTVDQSRRFGRLLVMTATALLILPLAAWLHGDLKLQGLAR